MTPLIMQDWITLKGPASTTVVMSESAWLLTAQFQDITFYLETKSATGGTVTCTYETCPGRDQALFYPMGTAVNLSQGNVVVTNYYAAQAQAPVSHWTRWKISGPAAIWDATFRILATGNTIC